MHVCAAACPLACKAYIILYLCKAQTAWHKLLHGHVCVHVPQTCCCWIAGLFESTASIEAVCGGRRIWDCIQGDP